MAETPTFNAVTRSGRPGDLENNPKQLVTLPLSLGCWGSIGAMSKTMDEARACCNQCGCQHNVIWSHDVEVTQHHKPLHSANLTDAIQSGHIYSTTHSFGYS